ncbi:DUF354 domain-containing protein [Natrinema sp. 1APR25-10V2]|uniref:DUF354 domain-containing protein n=1 Tax=Natrinema sp. 1APR25-10V2 TaxID=2951081 RepID=UPI0028742A12|nr:DUF354 domain-containing protein [Natrinema sp. 1APR25-10V2]MDS0474951.1 DUF354 domain-containing protein [Natrinema sp. 1APR25-10V2]
MAIIVTIQHGGNVHFFEHLIRTLRTADHDVHVFARESEVVGSLLESADIDHELLCGEPTTLLGSGLTQLRYEARILRRARAIDPDYIVSSHGIAASHVATLVGAESHIYIDTESSINHGNALTIPFADRVYTPSSFNEDLGDGHVRYPGYHELAYLHPDRFDPDPSLLRRNGVDPDDRYAVVRRGAFDSNHDIGKSGISTAGCQRIVDELARDGTVYVSDESDRPLPENARPIPVEPADFHQLLAFADLVVGDVATTTMEAGVLGTPTVRISPFAGDSDMGKFLELEEYGLVKSFPVDREAEAIESVERLYRDPATTAVWAERRERLLENKIDVTRFVLEELLDAAALEELSGAASEPITRERRPAESTDGRQSDEPIPNP